MALIICISFASFSQGSGDNNFSIIGIKSQLYSSNNDLICVTVFFNDTIDIETVTEKNILLNERPIGLSKILFSKRKRSFNFFIHKANDDFTLTIKNIKNEIGQQINTTQLSGFTGTTFWKYSKELNEWQKF